MTDSSRRGEADGHGPTSFTPAHFERYLPQLISANRLYVGLSGGLDSVVLLHGLCQVMAPHRLIGVHVNHGLHLQAGEWQEFCHHLCNDLGAGYLALTVAVAGRGSVEEAAREARYRAFAELLEDVDLLLLAHHRDDQLETILYRLLRGSGPRGLAGMPASRPLGRGALLRPLLAVGRQQLRRYARAHLLKWIEDPANRNLAYDRNYIRHRVLPLLAQRWPDYQRRLLLSADLCGAADRLADSLAEEDLQRLDARPARRGWSLSLAPFVRLSPERQANLLRFWIRQARLVVPGHRLIASVLEQLLPAQADAMPLIAWRGGELRRYGGRLYLATPLPSFVSGTVVPWDAGQRLLPLPLGSLLKAAEHTGAGLKLASESRLEIRFRAGGERCRPQGRAGSRPLKKLLQEYRLEPWLRDRVPLIYCDGRLAAVGDLFVCEGFQASPPEAGLQLTWKCDPGPAGNGCDTGGEAVNGH